MNVKFENEHNKYLSCPIPQTHRRLAEAHLLWHQALENYQNPDAFRANLNSCIEALRNVTFVLQNERAALSDFDEWYGPWQGKLKADAAAKWLHEARNTVVHQGELQSHSVAEVRLVTWRDQVIAQLKVPVAISSLKILENPEVLKLIDNSHTLKGDLKDAAIAIERRWSTADLGESELLDTLAKAYALLSDLVLDAHTRLHRFACIPKTADHPDFRSTYNRTGKLACMAAGPDQRTEMFKLDTKEQLLPEQAEFSVHLHPGENPGKRYGIDLGSVSGWEKLDPIHFAERILDQAKRILRKDKYHQRMMFVRNGQGEWQIHQLVAMDRTEKHLVMRMIARAVESESCDAIIEVGETWTAPAESAADPGFTEVASAKGRGEALFVVVATREGVCRTYTTPFKKGALGGIKLGDTVQTEGESLFYLEPIFEVWRRQGTVQRSDGKTLRRLWEPDGLDTCFCGGSKRFAECCQKHIPSDSSSHISHADIQEALARSDFARSEELARASVAQYLIWVKRHTEPMMHVAKELHDKLVAIDAAALDECVSDLGTCLEANGKADAFVSQVRRLAEIIGVPKLSMRLIALAGLWLFKHGRTEEAILELDGLGNPDKVLDPRVLTIAAEIMDFSPERREEILLRALSLTEDEEDRWNVQLVLIRQLIARDEEPRALPFIDSIIAESAGRVPQADPNTEAWMIRWRITRTPTDLHSLTEAIAKSPRPARVHYVAGLIDDGEYTLAEQLAGPDLAANDPMAKLLIADARIRDGKPSSARDLFLTVDQEHVPREAKDAYAVAAALVALSCKDERIRQLAIPLLREILSPEVIENGIPGLIAALQSETFGEPTPAT